jgi:hypothetical protein
MRHAAAAHWWFVEVFACVADGLHGTCVPSAYPQPIDKTSSKPFSKI